MRIPSKPLALLLAFIIIFTILSGCSQAEPETSEPVQSPAQSQNVTESAVPTGTEGALAPDEPQESENSTEPVKIEYPIADGNATLSYWLPWLPMISQYYDTYNDHPAYAYAEEATGVHIDYISCSMEAAQTEFNLMVISGDHPDIISNVNFYSGGIDKAIEDEVFLELTDLLPEYVPDYWSWLSKNESWQKFITTDSKKIGGLYGFNQVQLGLSQGYFIRQDWLDELGLGVPSTITEWEDTMMAFKTEYGVSDPLLMNSNLASSLSYAFGSGSFNVENASSLAFYLKDGKVVSCFTSDAYGDYIATLADWYDKGLIGVDFFSRTSNYQDSEITSLIFNGQAGIWNTVMSNRVDYERQAADAGFKNTPIGDPLKADGSLLTFYNDDPSAGSTCAISYESKNWELALKWCNYWFTEEGLLTANYGVEGISYDMVDGTPMFTEAVTNNPDGLIFQIARIMYCVNGAVSFGDPTIVRDFVYSDEIIACTAIWEAPYGSSDSSISSSVTMTTDESERFYGTYTDIGTYAQTEILRFVTGDRPIGEWGDFVNTCREIGIDDCTAIYQQAYDRYLER